MCGAQSGNSASAQGLADASIWAAWAQNFAKLPLHQFLFCWVCSKGD